MRQFHHVRRVVSHVLFVAVLFSSNPQLLVAQFTAPAPVCGSIEEPDGQIRELDLGNCENPFNAESGFPFTAILAGGILTEGAVFTLSLPSTETLLVESTGSAPVEYVTVYRKVGDDYQAVSVADTAFPRQYEVSFNTPGEYVLVINQDTGLVTQRETDAWLASLIPHAMAQSGDDVGATGVFARQFTIQEEVIEAPCGFIITPNLTEPVADCDNPFGFANPNADLAITFASSTIEDGGSYPLLDVFASFQVTGFDPFANIARLQLFRHVRDDYVQEVVGDVLRNDVSYEFASPGTYTIIFEEESLTVSQRSFDRFLQLLGPTTAHAAAGDRTIITFTITEPIGASSVLFLPGIQASRLYADTDIEVPGFFNDIEAGERLWEPGNNNDVRALAMTEQGVSVHGVHTQDVIDTTNLSITSGLSFDGSEVYEEFSTFMDSLTKGAEPVIKDWEPYAYDWRYSVFDIAQNGTKIDNAGTIQSAIEVIRDLAQESFSGQVSIVSHSNGGLLGKAILMELDKSNETHLVDRLIMIGTPQLGAPKSIGTILHGYDQEKLGGIVIDDVVAREIINNLPGAYGLLPSERLLEIATDPIVRFEDTEVTAMLRSVYGTSISDYGLFTEFLLGNQDTLDRSIEASISVPSRANPTLFTRAQIEQEMLDEWVAPEGVEVIEVVGVGLATMRSLLYRAIEERVCDIDPGSGVPTACANQTFLRPFAEMTVFGDETVPVLSAEGYEFEKQKFYLDLKELNKTGVVFSHANILEVDSIQTLLKDLIQGVSTTANLISLASPEITEEYTIEAIDSPVNILTTDSLGRQAGILIEGDTKIIKQEIPGSQYFEFAGTKYLIVPADTDRTTTLTGETHGGYTLTVAALSKDQQAVVHEVQNATVTPEMVAKYSVVNGTFSNIVTDFENDGVADVEFTIDGEVVIPDEAITYDTLAQAIKALLLSRKYEKLLLLQVRLAERFGKKADQKKVFARLEEGFLEGIRKSLAQHQRAGRITKVQFDEIKRIIKELKND